MSRCRRMRGTALLVATLLVATSCGGEPPGVRLYGNVHDYDPQGGIALLKDGRVVELGSTFPPTIVPFEPIRAISPLFQVVTAARGELFSYRRRGSEFVRVDAPVPVTPIGGAVFRTPDGQVFTYNDSTTKVTFLHSFRNATACSTFGCLIGGDFKPYTETHIVPGPFSEISTAAVPDDSGVYAEGTVVLRPNGVVVTITSDSDDFFFPPDRKGKPTILEIPELPAIAHLRDRFFEDRDEHIWFRGVAATVPPILYLETGELECTIRSRKYYPATCIGPTRVPAFDGTRPFVTEGGIVAITKLGELRCWVREGGACPMGE